LNGFGNALVTLVSTHREIFIRKKVVEMSRQLFEANYACKHTEKSNMEINGFIFQLTNALLQQNDFNSTTMFCGTPLATYAPLMFRIDRACRASLHGSRCGYRFLLFKGREQWFVVL